MTVSYIGRGRLQRRLSKYDEAVADFTEYIAKNPRSAVGYVGRGRVFYEMKLFQRAIIDYDQSVENDAEGDFYHESTV